MTTTEYMPLTDMKTLAQRLGEGRLPPAEALRCAIQLAGLPARTSREGKGTRRGDSVERSAGGGRVGIIAW